MYFSHAQTLEWSRAVAEICAAHPAVASGLVEFFVTPSYPAIPAVLEIMKGITVGVLTLVSGLDRIGLATLLRQDDVKFQVVTTPDDLVAGIADHRFDAGITEALLAGRLAADNKWVAAWMPPELPRYNLVLGLWKGDLTLKRAIVQAFSDLSADGTIAAILSRYAGTPLS